VSNFAAELRRLREVAGISQRALARASVLTPAYLSLLEGGRRRPERLTVEKLAQALALSDGESATLLIAAGYAATHTAPAHTHPPSDLEAILADGAFLPRQRAQIEALLLAYAQRLAARARAGKPLVADLAAPWQTRVLETMQEQIAAEVESFRASFERPVFDL